MIGESSGATYASTYATDPQLWDEGASMLAKVEYADQSQAVLASGWHRRQIEFENPGVEFSGPTEGLGFIAIGGTLGKKQLEWDGIVAYEIEVALDVQHSAEQTALLGRFCGESTAELIMASMGDMIKRVSANRANVVLEAEDHRKIYTVDLLCQNLPARSGNTDEPLRAVSRWCRIFKTDMGTITIYESLEPLEKAKLRWPHNAIWLNRGEDYYLTPSPVIGAALTAFQAPVEYELYNLSNWRIEFDFWENQPFQVMVADDADVAAARLTAVLKELAVLSEFITGAFLSMRNLQRRIQQNALLAVESDVKQYAKEKLEMIRDRIVEYRSLLEMASTLLANTAQSVQAVANREAAEAAEQTNTFLNFATAIFFIPTLIISFYSMSIIGQTEDDKVPTTAGVFVLCVVSVLIGTAGLYLYRLRMKKKRQRVKAAYLRKTK